ncbi:NupC/NupG family nucleoside CNT transporter [Acanthopleuribacter pedis]
MDLMSLVGMFSLLFLAWCLSVDRWNVNFKPILWGMGLQFVFALIILNQDNYSFLGMAVLALLLVNFNMREHMVVKDNLLMSAIANSTGAAALGLLGYFVNQVLPLWILAVLMVGLMVLNAYVLKRDHLRGPIAAAFVTFLFTYLIAERIPGEAIFDRFSAGVSEFLSFSDYGAQFIFGNLAKREYFFSDGGPFPGFGFQFGFVVLPTIIFFGGFMSVLYHLGIMQKVIEALSKFMRWTIGTSGAETLSCSANVFVGQTEAPLLIKPFLAKMTNSELLTIMVGGFATIAGGVLAGYINMGVNAGDLIAASVMSAPAALVIGKIIYPESEHSETAGDVPLPKIEVGENVLEAATNGISDGFKLALNVGAMLIGFIALIAVLDSILNILDWVIDYKLLGGEKYDYAITGTSPVVSEYAGIFPGSLQTLFGKLLTPLAFLMGVPWEDAEAVGNLLGVKMSLNEFVAFGSLGQYINDGVISPRAQRIATYALCGFANFSSIGIQIGGLAALAPERRSDLARVGIRAMFGGALASWTTATVAGIFL